MTESCFPLGSYHSWMHSLPRLFSTTNPYKFIYSTLMLQTIALVHTCQCWHFTYMLNYSLYAEKVYCGLLEILNTFRSARGGQHCGSSSFCSCHILLMSYTIRFIKKNKYIKINFKNIFCLMYPYMHLCVCSTICFHNGCVLQIRTFRIRANENAPPLCLME